MKIFFKVYVAGALCVVAIICGLIELTAQQQIAPVVQTFYVSGWRPTVQDPISTERVMVCRGKDRIDAIASCGLTVWTEKEWLDYQKNTPAPAGLFITSDATSSHLADVKGGFYKVCVDDSCVDIRDVMKWMQKQIAEMNK